MRVAFARAVIELPLERFGRETLLPLFQVCVPSAFIAFAVHYWGEPGTARFGWVLLAHSLCLLGFGIAFARGPVERSTLQRLFGEPPANVDFDVRAARGMADAARVANQVEVPRTESRAWVGEFRDELRGAALEAEVERRLEDLFVPDLDESGQPR